MQEFTFRFGALTTALNEVGWAVAKGGIRKYLTGVLIREEDGAITVNASGGGQFFATTRINGQAPQGACLVIAYRQLLTALEALAGRPEQPVVITVGDPLAPRLKVGETSFPRPLEGYDAADFPKRPAPLDIVGEVEGSRLLGAAVFVRGATSGHVVKVDIGADAVTLIAPDRSELAVAPVPNLKAHVEPVSGVVDLLRLSKLLPMLAARRVRIGWGSDRMFFSAGAVRAWMPTLSIVVADWRKEIPKTTAATITVARTSSSPRCAAPRGWEAQQRRSPHASRSALAHQRSPSCRV